MSGGGCENAGPYVSVCLYGDRREAWKTGCIFHVGGSFSWYDSADKTFSMVNGPSLLGENLRGRFGKCRFVASSQTCWPAVNGTNLSRICRCMCMRARSCAARASFLMAVRIESRCDSVGKSEGSIARGIAHGLYPYSNSKGAFFVTEWGCEL